MSVYEIVLQDPTENVAPPAHVLRVTSVDELVFVAIEEYDEAHDSRTFKRVADIAVSLPALREALDLLARDGQREDLRQKDERGQRGARLGGIRTTVVPL